MLLKSQQRAVELAALGIVCFVVFLILLTSSYGLEDLNFVQLYHSDEERTINLVQTHLQEGTLYPHRFYTNGHLYYSILFFIGKFLSLYHWNIDVRLIGMLGRVIALAFAVLSALALYKFAKIVRLPSELAAVAAVFFFTLPQFLDVAATQALSDSLQAFLIIAAFGVVLRRPDTAHALGGAALAGLAFGTKYAGLFLLPFCIIPRALVIFAGSGAVSSKLSSVLKLAIVATVIFILMFVITNPYALIDPDFYRDIQDEFDTLSTGFGKIEPKDPLYWLTVLKSEAGLLGVALLVAGSSLAAAQAIYDLLRGGWRACALSDSCRNKITILCYIISMVTFLAVAIHLRHPRYTYHMLPFWIVISLWGLRDLYRRFHFTRLSAEHLTGIIAIVLIALSAAQAERRIGATCDVPGSNPCPSSSMRGMAAATMRPSLPAVEAGNFISEHYPGNTRILAERYSRVPAKFVNTQFVWGLGEARDEKYIREFDPQLIIINLDMSGRWIWKAPGTKFEDKQFVVDPTYGEIPAKIKALWQSLNAQGWAVVYENPGIVILGMRGFERSKSSDVKH